MLIITADDLGMSRAVTKGILDSSNRDSLVTGTFPAPFENWSWRAEVVQINENEEYDLFSVGVAVDGFDESFALRTLVHEPRPVLQATGAAGGGGGRR